jgi:hypothetical protein
LDQLLEQQPATAPVCLVEPGLLPPQGILFVGGEPKAGKSLLVANLALSLAAGSDRLGFPIPTPCRVLVCQFELPVPQFVSRLASMRRLLGSAADQNLLVDTRASGHLLSAPQGLNHFLAAARAAAAEIIILDPLYSTHDQDENDTRAMAALCQSLLRLRQATRTALIVVHHVRKSIGRYEIGSAFRGSSALHAVGDSYLLVTRPALRSSLPSSYVSSSAMPLPSRRACWNSILSRCGSRRPVGRHLRRADIKSLERPIFHHLQNRTQTHIFLCVLAYHLLTAIEHGFLQAGMHTSWSTLGEHLSTHQIVTVVLHEAHSDRVLKIRKATMPEPLHREIYTTLRIPEEIVKPIKTWELKRGSDEKNLSYRKYRIRH